MDVNLVSDAMDGFQIIRRRSAPLQIFADHFSYPNTHDHNLRSRNRPPAAALMDEHSPGCKLAPGSHSGWEHLCAPTRPDSTTTSGPKSTSNPGTFAGEPYRLKPSLA
jgi:hypothetical protein